MSILEDLEQLNDVRAEQILQSLLQADESIKLKTHVVAPAEMSSLRLLETVLSASKLTQSASVVKTWLDVYEMYMVSWQRKSRDEIIRAVTGMLATRESEIQDRLKMGK